MKSTVLVLLIVVAATAAQAAERTVGLLALKDVFGENRVCNEDPAARPVLLYSAAASREVIGDIRVDHLTPVSEDEPRCAVRVYLRSGEISELPTGEYGYEEVGAVALDRRDNWFRIRLSDEGGAAWVHASADDPFYSFLDLLQKTDLAYLTDAWDKRIARSPGGKLRPLPDDPDRRMIGYLTPVSTDVTAVLAHGEDPEPLRKRYHSTGMGGVHNRDGTMTVVIHTSTQVDVFERPEPGAPVALRFWNDEVHHLRGTGTSVLVFDRRPGWFQVARPSDEAPLPWQSEQRLWLGESPAWEFHPVDDDAERETLANQSWGREYNDVRVLRFERVGDDLWAEIELRDSSICDAHGEPKPVGRGWVPAYNASGEWTIWFPSRGC